MSIRILLFDLDGTLTRPVLDFMAIRQDLGVPPGHAGSLLHWVDALHDAAARDAANATLLRHELAAAHLAEPNAGFDALRDWVLAHKPLVGVVTRNCRPAAEVTLRRLEFEPHVLITREDATPKPAPDAIHLALERIGGKPAHAVMVGDFLDDIVAGIAAGVAHTVFVDNGLPDRDCGGASHVTTDLRGVVEWLGRFQQ